MAELRARARLLEDEIASLEALPSLSSDNQRQRNVLSEELGAVRGQIAELSVAETFVAAGGEVIREATVPTQPVSPRPVATTLLALTLGLGLGVIGAYVRDRLDDRVREAPILERPPVGLQVLGQLPESEATATSGVDLLLAPLSPAAEAYRGLRSSLRFMSGSRAGDFRTIAVVSAEEAEGKTSVAANIAVAFAMTGQRVVVVDLDMRRPTLAGRFGLTTGVGASEVLSGQLAVGDAIVPVGVETLRLIGPGTSPPNPGSLITTGLRDMVGELTRVADVVVFDTPPMLAVADAMEVVAVVEATLTVARFGVSRRSAVRTATQRMRGLGANLVGAVITDVPTRATRYGYYGYGAGQDE